MSANSKRSNKLYNYLVNTFGLNKETILEYVDNRVQDLLPKHIDNKINSSKMEYMILGTVSNIINKGFGEHSPYYDRRVAFDKYVKKCIREEVIKIVKETKEIEVKLIDKDTSTIRRAD